MKLSYLALAAIISLVVWTWFTWPLPQFVFDGIPVSSRDIRPDGVRAMMKSDQLQLMYHYWLAQDMMTGDTPWFHNLYEFNTGNDAEREWPTAYFMPFSLVFAAGSLVAGRAFGMNLVGWVSLWLTLWLTWRLTRRYCDDPLWGGLAAVVSILVPFRWIAQLGGSPGGVTMMMVPLLCWGLDIAVRDRHWRGGVLAGLAVLLACWGDVQVFFFCGLFMPFWCLLAWVANPPARGERAACFRAWAVALSPSLVGIGAAFWYRAFLQPFLATSTMQGGRSIDVVAKFSPVWYGWFSWENLGVHNHVYLGTGLVLLVGLLPVVVWVRGTRREAGQSAWCYLLLVAAFVGVMLFALGPHGPGNGLVFNMVRAVIPGADMMRQPTRSFCLIPTLLAVALALGLPALRQVFPGRWGWRVPVFAMLLLVFDYALQVRATVCLLDKEQGAYAAIVADSRANGNVPHMLVLPLWPGDDVHGSLYQYWASTYRIRMVNGYSPVVATRYEEAIFRRFESANQGILSSDQLDELLTRGVRYLVVHEDMFPEKVSPFPVAATLCRLANHPRVRLLEQDGAVWAFSLHSESVNKGACREDFWFPGRVWEAEDLHVVSRTGPVRVVGDTLLSGGHCVVLDRPGATLTTRTTRTGFAPQLRWEIRLRGEGSVRVHAPNGAGVLEDTLETFSPEWEWRPLPLTRHQEFGPLSLHIEHLSGRVEIDTLLLTAGVWRIPGPGESLTLPATAFFHAGYGDLEGGTIHLRRRYDPKDRIWYGPKLPLVPGIFDVELHFESVPGDGVPLGDLVVGTGARQEPVCAVVSGEPARGHIEVEANTPLRFAFHYNRGGDMTLRELVLTRRGDTP